MALTIKKMIMGPMQNNVYLLMDEDSSDAVIIDPSFEPKQQFAVIQQLKLNLRQIWLTHGHFDHTTGAASLHKLVNPSPLIAMHPDAFAWTKKQPLAVSFGVSGDPVPGLDISLQQGQLLAINPESNSPVVEVREVPGHSPGSVLFYCESLGVAFTGDAIFHESIGRTDFPGGDYRLLISKIREQIFSLPDETKLLPGHGPESSVMHEKQYNPYLA